MEYNYISNRFNSLNQYIYIDANIDIYKIVHCNKIKKNFFFIASNLKKYYSDKFEIQIKSFNALVFYIDDSEHNKSLDYAYKLYDWLINNKVDRSSQIIAIGGGVTLDLVGFIASTILRGVKLINVPTTLLAQIDSAIGGKNGLNFWSAKNMIGTFYQPNNIICDVTYLKSLDKRDFISGLSEAVKMGIIYDASYFEFIKNNFAKITQDDSKLLIKIITPSVKHKANITSKDETEQFLRQILNFGHTIGHMLEGYFNYKYKHGEAVVAGMYFSTFLSTKLSNLKPDEAKIIYDLLNRFNVKIKFPVLKIDHFILLISKDKKTKDDTINFVLINAIGKYFLKKISINELHLYYNKFLDANII